MNRIFHLIARLTFVMVVISSANNLIAQTTDTTSSEKGFWSGWSAAVHFGVLAFHGDVSDRAYPYMRDWRLGYGLTVEKELSRYFGIRGQLVNGKLAGRNADLGLKFESDMLEASIQSTFSFSKFWQKPDYLHNYKTYALLGVGLANWESHLYDLKGSYVGGDGVGNGKGIDGRTVEGSVSVGLGLNLAVSDNLSIGIESSLHGTNSDKIDAVEKGASAIKQDLYSYTSFGLGYSFESKKTSKPSSSSSTAGAAWNSLKASDLSNNQPEIIQDKVGTAAQSTVDVIAWVVPDEVEEGEEFTLNIQIYKASIVGKGEIKVLLPENFYAPDQEIGPNTTLELNDRNFTITLDQLPEQFDFTLKVKVRSGKNPQGRYAIYILGRITDDKEQQYKLSSVVNFKQLAPLSAKK